MVWPIYEHTYDINTCIFAIHNRLGIEQQTSCSAPLILAQL